MTGESKDKDADAWLMDAIYELGGKEELCKVRYLSLQDLRYLKVFVHKDRLRYHCISMG